MRAMGLDPALLGQKFDVPHNAKAKSDEARCPSTNEDGDQCARRSGHDGVHARGYARWDEDAVTVQLVEEKESDDFTTPEGFTVSIPKIAKEVEDVSPQEDPDAG